MHSQPFKPSGKGNQHFQRGFKYLDEASQKAPGAKRLPNFVTNPPKQGNSSECGFGKFPGHMVDPADRARQM